MAFDLFHVFIDMDGVLANFKKRAVQIAGFDGHETGFKSKEHKRAYYETVYSSGGFFSSLELMDDAYELWNGVHNLGFNPTILTGLPSDGDINFDVPPDIQKREWAKKHFDTDRVITCLSADKFKHMMGPQDVLIDDWHKYISNWVSAGGYFILHKSAEQSLKELKEYQDWVISSEG